MKSPALALCLVALGFLPGWYYSDLTTRNRVQNDCHTMGNVRFDNLSYRCYPMLSPRPQFHRVSIVGKRDTVMSFYDRIKTSSATASGTGNITWTAASPQYAPAATGREH